MIFTKFKQKIFKYIPNFHFQDTGGQKQIKHNINKATQPNQKNMITVLSIMCRL